MLKADFTHYNTVYQVSRVVFRIAALVFCNTWYTLIQPVDSLIKLTQNISGHSYHYGSVDDIHLFIVTSLIAGVKRNLT